MNDLASLRNALRQFAAERDWEKFHSPKNLSMALIAEAAELVEQFQWLTEEESRNLDGKKREAVEAEIADIFLYLVRLSDKLDIDLVAAAHGKMAVNQGKYPAEKVRGSAKKYDEY